jgi:hypothetical protein
MEGLCELCARRPAAHRHHIRNRGRGGAFECNHKVNLLKVCVECHNIIHYEGTTGVLFILSGRRFGMSQAQVMAIVREEMKK